MKTIAAIILSLAAAAATAAQRKTPDYGLPELHKLQTVKLAPSYSCRTSEEFQKGYAETALFVSKYSKQINSPELLFNGACNSDDYFQVSMAGDAFSLIADLGTDVSLEDVSASRAFNLRRVHTDADYSKFAQVAKVIPGHAYAIVMNDSQKRGLIVFRVTEYRPNEAVEIQYAVKSYHITQAVAVRAPGFDWDRTNQ